MVKLPFRTHRIQSCGFGVQSSTLLLKAEYGEIDRPEHAIFADTQREPKSVYTWIEYLRSRVKHVPIHIVSHGDLGSDSLVVNQSKLSGKLYQKNLLPLFIKKPDGKRGILVRKCTSEYKIRQIQKKCRELYADEYRTWRRHFKDELREFNAAKKEKRACDPQAWRRMQDNALIEALIGISTDEADRMKPSREPWVRTTYPLIELGMSRADCIAWFAERGLPRPPRSSCYFCPYHGDAEWLRLQRDEPEEFARAVQFEKEVQAANCLDEVARGVPFLHDSLVPLDQVKFTDSPDKFGNDCAGVCGVDL